MEADPLAVVDKEDWSKEDIGMILNWFIIISCLAISGMGFGLGEEGLLATVSDIFVCDRQSRVF